MSWRCSRRARAPACCAGWPTTRDWRTTGQYQTRYGDWRELFRELDQIDKVSKADIRRVANKVFVDSNRTNARIEFTPPAQPAAPAAQWRCK